MEKTTIKELINLLEQELIQMGYKESTLHYYRENWKRLIAYFDEHGEQFFCEKTAMQYVDEKCDFFAKEKAGLLTQSNIYLLRIVRMIGDFQEHGGKVFLYFLRRRYQRSLSKIKKTENLNLLNDFKEHCKAADYSASTQKSYCRTAENFLSFMEAHDTNVKEMTAKNLAAFVKTLMGYSYKTVEFVLCGTRAFLRFFPNPQNSNIKSIVL